MIVNIISNQWFKVCYACVGSGVGCLGVDGGQGWGGGRGRGAEGVV